MPLVCLGDTRASVVSCPGDPGALGGCAPHLVTGSLESFLKMNEQYQD